MSGAPRGRGRGAAILAYLKAQALEGQSEQASSSRTSSTPVPPTSAPEPPSPAPEPPAPAPEPSASAPEPLAPGPAPTIKIGRGRSALLRRLKEEYAQNPGELPQEKPLPDSTTSKVEEVQQLFEDVEIPEKDIVTYRGESGKPIRTCTNYIKLHAKETCIYQYEVKFSPDIDARGRRNRAVNQAMQEFDSPKLFDGGSILYLPKQIIQTYKKVMVNLPGPSGDEQFEVSMIFRKRKSFGDYECLSLYNVLLKRIMYILLYQRMGRNYFDTEHRSLIPQHKLEIYPGYAVSVSEEESGLMICLDSQHRILSSQNIYEKLLEYRCSDPRRFKELASTNIIGSVVLTRYNYNTYVVSDIAWDMTPQDTFPNRNGGETNFIEYYKAQYDITIKDVNQPLLISRKNVKISGSSQKEERMICLIPELCCVTSLTEDQRNDFNIMKDVAMHTRITPNQRLAAMKTFLSNVKKSPEANKVLTDWGLSIAPDPVVLDARVLQNEQIHFGNEKVIMTKNNADWNREISENQVTGPVNMYNWILVHTERDSENARTFAGNFVRLGPTMGCAIKPPRIIKLKDDRNDSWMNTIRENVTKNLQFIVFICPTSRTDRYSTIKRLTSTQFPISSQVINSRTLSNPKKVRSIIQKIALQIVCKLGGSLWTIKFPFRNWMICGMDVYHGKGQKSVCGFVTSIDESISKWFSTTIFQEGEISNYIKQGFLKSLNFYRDQNGFFPSKIVIIRDGVSDGQLDYCERYEIEQVTSVLRDFCPETKLCFIVVQKRINQRFYAVTSRDMENPPPGTVIDHTVTRKYLHDFFLVPQSVRQGTVNPTHYIVLYDTCQLKPDHVQRLCFKLCHLYYNWPGTIKVPAPCQYAHKLAAFVGQHIKTTPNALLSDKLHYL